MNHKTLAPKGWDEIAAGVEKGLRAHAQSMAEMEKSHLRQSVLIELGRLQDSYAEDIWLSDKDVAHLAGRENMRLVQVLVRMSCCRFVCSAQDAKLLIDSVENHIPDSYCRDVSVYVYSR